MIPDPSGQLAELIVYITSTRLDLHSHQILLLHPYMPWHYYGEVWQEGQMPQPSQQDSVSNVLYVCAGGLTPMIVYHSVKPTSSPFY